MQHMASVTIHAHTPAFAPMPHLGVFVADEAIFGNPFDQAYLPLLIACDILRMNVLSDLQGWLSQFHLFLLKRLHPDFYGLQDLQDEPECCFSLPRLIPVAIACCFQAGPAHHCCSSFLPYLCHSSSLLLGHHTYDLVSVRARSACTYPRLGLLPTADCCPMLPVSP